MKPTEWLIDRAPGFGELPCKERDAIRDFALLWSYFEISVLNGYANADKIVEAVTQLARLNRLPSGEIQTEIDYFRKRYYDGNKFTDKFKALRFRNNDRKSIVEDVIRGKSDNEVEILSAILIIVLRLRNNLFHGAKWANELSGQLNNFTNANNVLMAFMDLHRPQ